MSWPCPTGRAGERARHPAHEPLGAACPACSSPCACAGASPSPSSCPGPGRPGGAWATSSGKPAAEPDAALPALPAPHARDRGDRLPRAADGGRRLSGARVPTPRQLVGLAVAVGWLAVYFAWRQSWLGLLFGFAATALVLLAIRRRDLITRREQAALSQALAASAARRPGAGALSPSRRDPARWKRSDRPGPRSRLSGGRPARRRVGGSHTGGRGRTLPAAWPLPSARWSGRRGG